MVGGKEGLVIGGAQIADGQIEACKVQIIGFLTLCIICLPIFLRSPPNSHLHDFVMIIGNI